MLYYNTVSGRTNLPDAAEALAAMKWFRSNIRLASLVALFALAIQFLLSFGHFHGSSAQTLLNAKQSGLHDAVRFVAAHFSDRGPDGQPTHECAICAVMVLADAVVVATPPYLLGPQATAFRYLTADVGFADLNSARVVFQPRAPPSPDIDVG